MSPGKPSAPWRVSSDSRPAIASVPPLGSSTVVSARRTFSAGITRSRSTTAPSLDSWLPSAAIADGLEGDIDAKGLPAPRDLPVVGGHRHRKLAASQEFRRLAGDGGE